MNDVTNRSDAGVPRLIAVGSVVFTTVVGLFANTTDARAQALVADARGRVVLATVGATARYRADGTLDPTFGIDGVANLSVGDYSHLPAVDASPDGTIVLAACAFSEATGITFEVAKVTAQGTLDPSFQTDEIAFSDPSPDCVAQVNILAGGRILVAGYWLTPDGASDFIVARYNRDGSLDATFGAGGRLVSDLRLARIAVTAGGSIVALAIQEPAFRDTLLLARFTRDGQLDVDFGSAGVATVILPVPAYFEHIAVMRDGQIVVGGSVAPAVEEPYAAIARFTHAGELDPAFGSNGIVATRISDSDLVYVTAIGVEPNGTVFAAGFTFGRPFVPFETRLVLMRFDRRGRQDGSFGTNGFYLRPTDRQHATLAVLNGGGAVLGGYDASGQYVLTRVRRT